MSFLAQLDRLDHRFVGRPEADYVFESRRWRLRLALSVLLTLVSLLIVVVGDAGAVAWVPVVFAVGTGVQTVLARSAWRRTAVQAQGHSFEVA